MAISRTCWRNLYLGFRGSWTTLLSTSWEIPKSTMFHGNPTFKPRIPCHETHGFCCCCCCCWPIWSKLVRKWPVGFVGVAGFVFAIRWKKIWKLVPTSCLIVKKNTSHVLRPLWETLHLRRNRLVTSYEYILTYFNFWGCVKFRIPLLFIWNYHHALLWKHYKQQTTDFVGIPGDASQRSSWNSVAKQKSPRHFFDVFFDQRNS